MGEQLRVIALISGGKDSLYSILHCLKHGHQVVALANLYPPQTHNKSTNPNLSPSARQQEDMAKDDSEIEENEEEDMDSYMYQTVGHSVIPLYETALGIPLYRQQIDGHAVNTSLDYYHPSSSTISVEADETECLYQLLQRVMEAHPEANAVCAGAVLSTYQRTRIENVTARLGIISLAWLWMYPYLPPPLERAGVESVTGLLDDMSACGCEARIIKVASGGLDQDSLWADVASIDGSIRKSLVKKLGRFMDDGIEGAVLGEGGEYETLALNGPSYLWRQKIVIDSVIKGTADAGVSYLRLQGAHCAEARGNSERKEDLRTPQLFDGEFQRVLQDIQLTLTSYTNNITSMLKQRVENAWENPAIKPISPSLSGNVWNVYNLAAPDAGETAEQTEAICQQLAMLLFSRMNVDGSKLTADDAIYSTILLRSMEDFVSVNTKYATLFSKPNPPARVTIACGDALPPGVNVMMSFSFYLGSENHIQALHVQSRSYWAPSNIGPYSQSVSIPATEPPADGRLIYIAGQIPLEPSSMQLYPPSQEPQQSLKAFASSTILSLQHLWRIGKAMKTNWWLGAVAFVSTTADIQPMAAMAVDIWRRMNSRQEPPCPEDDDENAPETGLDAWDIKYGRQYEQTEKNVTAYKLPNFEIAEGSPEVPPCFVVHVDGLPRGSSIEWQGFGLNTKGIILTQESLKGLRITHSYGCSFGWYTSVGISAEGNIGLAGLVEKATKAARKKLPGDNAFSHTIIYSPYSMELEGWEDYDGMATYERNHEHDGDQLSNTNAITENPNLPSYSHTRHPYNSPIRHATVENKLVWHETINPIGDSGTEADDEGNGVSRNSSVPASNHILDNRLQDHSQGDHGTAISGGRVAILRRASRRRGAESSETEEVEIRTLSIGTRLRIEVLRRLCETALVLVVALIVVIRDEVRSVIRSWWIELLIFAVQVVGVYAIFPLRMCPNGSYRSKWKRIISFPFSRDIDPAPLIYPILLPLLVILSLGTSCQSLILPNIILSLSSLPASTIPVLDLNEYSCVQWTIVSFPIFISETFLSGSQKWGVSHGLNAEILTLIFPLQKTTVSTLDFLFTTSLLPTELQLLATVLINVLIFSQSPWAQILKSLFWLGGVYMLVTSRHVLHWGMALATIPSWKFRRSNDQSHETDNILSTWDRQLCRRLSRGFDEGQSSESDEPLGLVSARNGRLSQIDSKTNGFSRIDGVLHTEKIGTSHSIDPNPQVIETISSGSKEDTSVKTTRGGRRKRIISSTTRPFLALTPEQAHVRKWAYAVYTYMMVVFAIFLPIRLYVAENALQGREPFGWAIGYLFGNISSVRLSLLLWSLDTWVCIPPRIPPNSMAYCHLGWIEHLRQTTFGEANARLIMCAYCLLVLIVGISLVLRLSNIVEVDTRRKIFHGMMVMMFLPTIFIDPTFVALAFVLVLAIFLLLELFRASRLPPVSKAITNFLAPYIDGRDRRGPVVVSHIFLLLGCALPLWLSLAGKKHSGSYPWEGWDVQGRDISMVSGVVCVGMGDAAASLVGRRFGRKRWFWGGDKSIEGSLAFAVAVFTGILLAQAWMVAGGWGSEVQWTLVVIKSAFAAVASSFMEAVLTGGNDNVVVPLVLWLLVRGLDI
ncbi:hypothetical protein FQN57_005698 [Myotisia sp. PD_48]|nr:hypothetical protein FQN57_005698 [Myotisia sp. PD_48]